MQDYRAYREDLLILFVGHAQERHPELDKIPHVEYRGGPALNRRTILMGLGAAATLPMGAWAASSAALASRTFAIPAISRHYLECGPAEGPLMVFLHGWPELSLIWRAQMEAFASGGWRCIAPDMRGYGGSSAPAGIDAYTNEQIVRTWRNCMTISGGEPAIWVGHDWGSVIAGSLVAHEPARSRGLVLISVPYFPDANALPTLVPLIDRTIYPADMYPDGQWDYYRYYTTHFEAAVSDLDADKAASLASIYRSGDPTSIGKPSANALVTQKGRTLRRCASCAADYARSSALASGGFRRSGRGLRCPWLSPAMRVVFERRGQHCLCPQRAERWPDFAARAVREWRVRPDQHHQRQPLRRADARGLRRLDDGKPARSALAAARAQAGTCPSNPGVAPGQEPVGSATVRMET